MSDRHQSSGDTIDRLLHLLHEAHAEMTDGPAVPFGRWLADDGHEAVPQEARELREAYDVHTERMDAAETQRDEARDQARGYRDAYNAVNPLASGQHDTLPWETVR